METRHPTRVSLVVNFRQSVIIEYSYDGLKWLDLKILLAIFAFFKKRPIAVKFSKFCSESVHRLTDRRCCVKMSWNVSDGIWGRNRTLYTWQKENFACLLNCRYCTDRAQNLPGPGPSNVLTVLQISSKSVYFRRSYSRTREHRFLHRRVFPWFTRSYASLPANNYTRWNVANIISSTLEKKIILMRLFDEPIACVIRMRIVYWSL